jgi:GTPase SAR1 family protein
MMAKVNPSRLTVSKLQALPQRRPLFKVTVLGVIGSGKTTFVNRFETGNFSNPNATIQVEGHRFSMATCELQVRSEKGKKDSAFFF